MCCLEFSPLDRGPRLPFIIYGRDVLLPAIVSNGWDKLAILMRAIKQLATGAKICPYPKPIAISCLDLNLLSTRLESLQ